MKSREEIITSMCYTFRHDYGLTKNADPAGYTFPGTAGMTPEEQKFLWGQMAQIFDNDIAPNMRFKTENEAKYENEVAEFFKNQSHYSE